MGTIVAISNQKGGVGKTTTVVDLGHYFANQGQRVLAVDLDTQGHVALCLGLAKSDGIKRIIVDGESFDRVVVNARPGLDVLTGDKSTSKIITHLSNVSFRELRVAQVLTAIAAKYDVVLIDVSPNSDFIHVSALIASDYYLVPAAMDFLALEAVSEIVRTVQALAEIPNVNPPELIGILPTKYDRTTNETINNVARLGQMVGQQYILPPIPGDSKLRESTTYGKTIWEHAPRSAGAIGFKNGSSRTNSLGNVGGYLHLGEIMNSLLR
jgi:chromosome partitioning protein